MKTKILSRIMKLGIISLFLTFAVTTVASASDFYWVNAGGDNLWTNLNNWSVTPGGAGGTVRSPSLLDNAIFTSDVSANATINVGNLLVQSLTVERGYNGTITGATSGSLMLGELFVADGTVDLTPLTTLTVNGDLIIDGGTTSTPDSTTVAKNLYVNNVLGVGMIGSSSNFDGTLDMSLASNPTFNTTSGNVYIGQSGSTGTVTFAQDDSMIYGNFIQATNSGTSFSSGTGTIDMARTGAQSLTLATGQNIYYLSINSGSITTLSSDISATTLSVGGTLNAGSNTITAQGFVNSGTFNANTGTVVLTGTNSTLSGNTTFNNLTKSVTSASTLTITQGTTQTITGALTLNGIAGQLLSIRSSLPGTQYNFSSTNSTLSYVDLQDFNDVLSVMSADESVDSGNNTNMSWTGSVSFTVPEFSTYMLLLVLMGGMYFIYNKSKAFQE